MPRLRQSGRGPSWWCDCQRSSDGANPAWTISGRMSGENNRVAKARAPSSGRDDPNAAARGALQKFGGTVWIHPPASRSNAEQTSRDAPEVLVCTSWQGNSLWPGRAVKHARCHYDISNLGQIMPQSYRTLIFFRTLLPSPECVSIPGGASAETYKHARPLMQTPRVNARRVRPPGDDGLNAGSVLAPTSLARSDPTAGASVDPDRVATRKHQISRHGFPRLGRCAGMV